MHCVVRLWKLPTSSGNWQTAHSICASQLAPRTMYNRVFIPHQGQRSLLHPCRGCCGDLFVFPKHVDEWLVIRTYLEPVSVEILMKTPPCLSGHSSSQRGIEYVMHTRLVSQCHHPLHVQVLVPVHMVRHCR